MSAILHTVFVSASLMSYGLCQGTPSTQTPEKGKPNPCQHAVLQKAQAQGLNSLTLAEIPQFWLRSWQCKRYARKQGQSISFRQLHKQKQIENYEQSREISGLGSYCATTAILILVYSYYNYFVAPD